VKSGEETRIFYSQTFVLYALCCIHANDHW
jgi:hypothetical protein